MGFFSNLGDALSSPKLNDPVHGTAEVVSVSMPPHQSGGGGMCTMHLVITVPGQPSAAVQKAQIVMLDKWPMPGTVLPVVAERNNSASFSILWDQAPTSSERGAALAAQRAAVLNQNPPPAAPDGTAPDSSAPAGSAPGAPRPTARGPFGVTTSVTINGQPASAADVAPFEAMTGLDLNGDGVVGGNPGGAAPATAPATSTSTSDAPRGDPVARLERLAALHRSGALSDAEFTAAKAQILGSGE